MKKQHRCRWKSRTPSWARRLQHNGFKRYHSTAAAIRICSPYRPAVLVKGSYLFLECTLDTVFDGFGPNSLITGKIVAAAAEEDALRSEDLDDSDQIFTAPLLAYLSPGRFAEIRQTRAFPFPKGFSR